MQTRVQIPDARSSAIGFTEGVRTGWIASDFLVWADLHLIRPGRLAVGGNSGLRQLREHDFGTVVLQTPNTARPGKSKSLTLSQVPHVLSLARQRVVDALRDSVRTGQPAFVNAALYAGRVARCKGEDGRSLWRVTLREDTALSDQVLALFAADALEHPADYECELSVCDTCGAVSISSAGVSSRRGCPVHPFGGRESSVRPAVSVPAGRAMNS
jgi:hypothetical protein